MANHLFSNICRACSCKTHNQQQLNAIISNEHPREVHVMLQLLTPQLSVELNDELPQQICDPCFDQLEKAYAFQQMCIKSEEEFHQIVGGKAIDPLFTNLLVIPEERKDNDLFKEEQVETIAGDTLAIFVADDEVRTQPDNITERSQKVLKNIECGECDKSFDRKSHLQRHQKMHSKERPFACSLCNYRYTSKSFLAAHITAIHSDKNGKIVSVANPDQHGSTHRKLHSQRQEFEQIEREKAVDALHTNLLPIQEENINEALSDKQSEPIADDAAADKLSEDDQTEMQSQESLNNLQCTKCHKSLSRNYSLQGHQKLHLKEPAQDQFVLPKALEPVNILEIQESEIVSEIKIEEEDPVTHIFTADNETQVQPDKIIEKYERRAKNFGCNLCGRSFDRIYSLRRHELLHLRGRPFRQRKSFKCYVCDKSFSRSYCLRRHLKTHSKGRELPQKAKDPLFTNLTVIKTEKECINEIKIGDAKATADDSLANNEMQAQTDQIVEKNEQQPNMFRCNLCGESFNKIYSLSRHQKLHPRNRKIIQLKSFKCYECDKSFSRSYCLRRHLKTHSKGRRRMPQTAKDPLFTNLTIIKTEKEYIDETKIVDAKATAIDSLTNNEMQAQTEQIMSKNEQQPNMFRCNLCGKSFNRNFSLRRHQELHTRSRPVAQKKIFKCNLCNKSFNRNYGLRRHQKVHAKESSTVHFCGDQKTEDIHLQQSTQNINSQEYSNETFTTKTQLKKHNDEMNETATYKCQQCFQTFLSETLLEKHLIWHQKKGSNVREYKCYHCQEVFQKREVRLQHIYLQHENDVFTCIECGKQFKKYWALKQHMSAHTVERPIQCDKCPKKFKNLTHLRKHSHVHRERDEHECDVCAKTLSSFSSLLLHKRIHQGIRPYQCEQCGKSFPRSSNLRNHQLRHKGIMTKCKYCPRSFRNSGDLLRHERGHFGGYLYRCQQCKEKFKYKTELLAHESQHFLQQRKTAENRKQQEEHGNQTDAMSNKSEEE